MVVIIVVTAVIALAKQAKGTRIPPYSAMQNCLATAAIFQFLRPCLRLRAGEEHAEVLA